MEIEGANISIQQPAMGAKLAAPNSRASELRALTPRPPWVTARALSCYTHGMSIDFGQLLDSWKGLLATADAEGFFRHLTRDWEETLGWSREELTARPFVDFVHPDDREATLAVAARLPSEDQELVHFQNRYECKDGSYKWISWTASVDSSSGLIFATAHDISAHVETQQRLEQALGEAQTFRRLLEATSDHVGLANPDGTIFFTNRAGLEMLGTSAEQLYGSHISTVHPPAYNARLAQDAIPRVREEGSWSGEGELLRADGSVLPISQVIVQLPDHAGQQSATGTFIRDISRAKQLEAELRAQAERLSAALMAMSTPLIPLTSEIVVMPLIGQMDSERAQQVIEVALEGVEQSGAKIVLLDITGLASLDAEVASTLVRAARALRLLGAQTILTGVRPKVAQTLVSLELDLEGIRTQATLQAAIAQLLGT